MFDKSGPLMLPNHKKFVESLTLAQATYLYVSLKDVRGRTVMPLREALMNRVLGEPTAARQEMLREFYEPTKPIQAVPVAVPKARPRR